MRMPVTAKLSKKFYEKLGEDVTNELVDWFNQVDATYRADLRELNELNFARFDAKLEQRVAELDAKFETRLAEFEARLEQRFATFQAEVNTRFTELAAKFETRHTELDTKFETRISDLDAKVETRTSTLESRVADIDLRVSELRSELIKWMFVFWASTALIMFGLS